MIQAESMLDVARCNIELALLTERIMLDRVDAKVLPYDDGRFPIVMSNSIVHHIPDPTDVFREAVRVTAAGGLLFFLCHHGLISSSFYSVSSLFSIVRPMVSFTNSLRRSATKLTVEMVWA